MAQKITPNLWFDTEAQEAADFYLSVFKNSRIVNLTLHAPRGRIGPSPRRSPSQARAHEVSR
jgi:predicted 3-demethylubiquinone-9 3-methyltransferase (glyoxalase superfamily)